MSPRVPQCPALGMYHCLRVFLGAQWGRGWEYAGFSVLPSFSARCSEVALCFPLLLQPLVFQSLEFV